MVDWKEFFKPTWKNIIGTITVAGASFVSMTLLLATHMDTAWSGGSGENILGMFLSFIGWILGFPFLIGIHPLIFLPYFYLVSCIILYFTNKKRAKKVGTSIKK